MKFKSKGGAHYQPERRTVMCSCNVELVIYRYEDYQMELCPVCGDCEPEPLGLSAEEELAYDMLIAQEEAAYDELMESAVVAAY